MEVVRVPFWPLLAALAEVRDPRRAQGQRYSLRHLLLFSVLAVLAAAAPHPATSTFIRPPPPSPDTLFGACVRRSPGANYLSHPFLAHAPDGLAPALRPDT